MMHNRYKKPLLIIGAIVLLLVLVALFTDTGSKLAKFGTISGNIATNLAHPAHGDTRDLDTITVDYIKHQTGSTDEVNVANLPKAFRPLKKYKHPPFSMGACQVCHAPKRSKPAAIITKTVWELCYKCHEPSAGEHNADLAIDCNRCHNPHHADKKHLIREKVVDEQCPVGHFKE